ncbi:hypothetical protein V8G54_009419 [Vigna mungo]|uniref:Uncharacterized protein n=1 Tax=Vigna mungo TaxID=3915 RepID=A0AAQ3NWQ7_VIGMU
MTNIENHDLAAVDAPATWMRFRVDIAGELRCWRQSSHGATAVRAKEMTAMMEVRRCEHDFSQDANSNSIAIGFSLASTAKKQASMVPPWNLDENEGNTALAERLAVDEIWRRRWLRVTVSGRCATVACRFWYA